MDAADRSESYEPDRHSLLRTDVRRICAFNSYFGAAASVVGVLVLSLRKDGAQPHQSSIPVSGP